MSPKYDAAKIENLSDADKLRLISAYLNHNEPNNVRQSRCNFLEPVHPH